MAPLVSDLAEIHIRIPSDVPVLRRTTRIFLSEAGFDQVAIEEMVLVAVELGTNLLRHASAGGVLTLRSVNSETGVGVEITSRDLGPGIADIELALKDGTSTIGGLGGGLSTVRSFADEFSIASEPSGTVIVARRWVRQ
jgi:serine/threonine-protein kinase RsbT